MDALKLHLILNYYPAIGMVIASGILVVGAWHRRAATQRLGLKIVVVSVLFTLAVAFTGEFAGMAETQTSGPRADALSSHKISGTTAFVMALIAGIMAVAGLVRGRTDAERPKRLYAITLIVAVVSSVLLITTIFKGRQVKWASNGAPAVFRTTDTENKLWHA